jgi:hypothetical protein
VPNVTFGATPVTQLLGVNDHNKAVGFYVDAMGNSHGFKYDIRDNSFTPVTVEGASSVTAAGINNRGDIAGFFTNIGGVVQSFLQLHDGQVITLAVPGATSTTATGVNDSGEVVGVYMVGTALHGFTWTAKHGFQTVDDPNGVGTTTVNGVNDHGDLVGFYVDSAGNTDGMLVKPRS